MLLNGVHYLCSAFSTGGDGLDNWWSPVRGWSCRYLWRCWQVIAVMPTGVRGVGVQIEHHLQEHDGVIGSITVGLVHDEDVGDFHEAGFDGLYVIAETRCLHDQGGMSRSSDLNFGLGLLLPFPPV